MSNAVQNVKVWDTPLRLFHWILVAAFSPRSAESRTSDDR
jgi:cytochrome b